MEELLKYINVGSTPIVAVLLVYLLTKYIPGRDAQFMAEINRGRAEFAEQLKSQRAEFLASIKDFQHEWLVETRTQRTEYLEATNRQRADSILALKEHMIEFRRMIREEGRE